MISRITTLLMSVLMVGFFSLHTRGQVSPIEISYREANRGGYTFFAENKSPVPYVVVLNFYNLQNLDSSYRMPYAADTKAENRTRILTLNKNYKGERSNFRYRYRYFTGCLKTEPEDLPYLLPYPEGQTAKMRLLYNVNRHVTDQLPDDWYAMQFITGSETPITASRKGMVVGLKDGLNEQNKYVSYTSKHNYVIVVHEDCTFARYNTFKNDQIFVDFGETVYPGDTLGISAGNEFGMGNQVRLTVYYRNDESISYDPDKVKGISPWSYHKPKFTTKQVHNNYLEQNQEYTSIHPTKIIIQEMSRRERKKWKKKTH